MLRHINIENFKSHINTKLELGNITFLCGENGVGKSSVIQSLLLLRQSFEKNMLKDGLDLAGNLVNLGTAKDVMRTREGVQDMIIRLDTDNQNYEWVFPKINLIQNDKGNFLNISQGNQDYSQNIQKNAFSLFGNEFQYLSAERLPPQESYPRKTYDVEKKKQISIEKGRGELVAHFLEYYKDYQVLEGLKHHSLSYSDLLAQTSAWEREISQNVNIRVETTGTGYELKYSFDTTSEQGKTEEFRPENVGFGLSYALPIIVSILAAKKDALILIENPEAHLHPYGQAKLTELMCLAAETGIQVIVETHSDHIINGAMVACKKGIIKKENISIYQFNRDENTHAAETIKVEVLEGGRIKKAPAGFFDQFGKDLRTLMS